MTARTTKTGGQLNAAGEREGTKGTCIHDKTFDSIPFQLGDHVCWAVRPDILDVAADNGKERVSAECDARSLCGWLRIGNEAYLVVTELNEVDGSADQELAKTEPWETLSERETQIAILVSLGKGTKQIAGRLLISEHTVQSYMRRIFSKLHVSTRAAMVAQLMRSRIILRNLVATAPKADHTQ